MSEPWLMIDRCAYAGRVAHERGEPLSSNPWPLDTVGGHSWALGWHWQALPWWMRLVGRALATVVHNE